MVARTIHCAGLVSVFAMTPSDFCVNCETLILHASLRLAGCSLADLRQNKSSGAPDEIRGQEQEIRGQEACQERHLTLCQERRRPQCPGDWTLIGHGCYQSGQAEIYQYERIFLSHRPSQDGFL